MSFLSRLIDHVRAVAGQSRFDRDADERLAAAALLVHVARVDGVLNAAEQARLKDLLRGRFGLSAGAAARLTARGGAVGERGDDLSELAHAAAGQASPDERRRLVGMAYAVAAADGRMLEFEEDLVWRLGRLLGLDDAAVAAIPDEVLPPEAVTD